MPPKKTQKKVIPQFPAATSAFKFNQGGHYKASDNPPMLNQIPIPIGANGCLEGINFVVTGTMPSLTREMTKDLIEKYGGRLTTSISGKTDVLIRGCEEVGPKKLQEAQSRKIMITDQDGLFAVIANSNSQYKSTAPATTPTPPQETNSSAPKTKQTKQTKQTKNKEEDANNDVSPEEANRADILANLPKPTSSFELFRGYYEGIGENPPQHNQIPIPTGANQCLIGLTFSSTGTMPSLLPQELKDLIEKYGGTYLKGISKKVHVLIRGCIDVGEKKLAEAKTKNIPIIDQEGLFEIIKKSNTKNKQQPQPPEPTEVFDDNLSTPYSTSLLSEKYRPRSIKEVVGNIGPINQFRAWITKFDKTKTSSTTEKKAQRPIALVSGPTGVGKTTSVHLICEECGFSTSEFNASDTRSKKFIDEIRVSTSNYTFNRAEGLSTRKHALVFEDIEDMSRSYSYLIELAQKSKIPIICICNDANNAKLDTLSKYSLSIRFSPPKKEEIRPRLRFICRKEGINDITDDELDDIITESKNDVRFAINSIQYWGRWTDESKNSAVKTEFITDVMQAVITILTPTSQMLLDKKFDAFFYDYSQVPLYVEQNLPLPNMNNSKPTKEDRHNYVDALESICYGDMIDNCIRENQNYTLLSAEAVTSSIYPSECIQANVVAVTMPKLYGATKKQQKFQKYIQEIGQRTDTFTMQPKAKIYDSFSYLLFNIYNQLKTKSKDSYSKLLSFLDSLGLTPDDFDHIGELISFEKKKSKDSDSIGTEIMKRYKQRHADDPKKISSETDYRALHNIRQISGKTKSIK